MTHIPNNPVAQQAAMNQYYAYQSKIYDATRWSFLFGRQKVLKLLKKKMPDAQNILEIGCGTGINLKELSRLYLKTKLWGIEGAADMYKIAQKRLGGAKPLANLIHRPYQKNHNLALPPVDAIIFSYVLTMINPHYEEIILQALQDLPQGGRIVVVDFHTSHSEKFCKWMEMNHVVMQMQLVPILVDHFQVEHLEIPTAYNGLWKYFMFIGTKK
jgi:S-adenosylmethionine-diacylgycerolhomoserine-N-methlytransferase